MSVAGGQLSTCLPCGSGKKKKGGKKGSRRGEIVEKEGGSLWRLKKEESCKQISKEFLVQKKLGKSNIYRSVSAKREGEKENLTFEQKVSRTVGKEGDRERKTVFSRPFGGGMYCWAYCRIQTAIENSQGK